MLKKFLTIFIILITLVCASSPVLAEKFNINNFEGTSGLIDTADKGGYEPEDYLDSENLSLTIAIIIETVLSILGIVFLILKGSNFKWSNAKRLPANEFTWI